MTSICMLSIYVEPAAAAEGSIDTIKEEAKSEETLKKKKKAKNISALPNSEGGRSHHLNSIPSTYTQTFTCPFISLCTLQYCTLITPPFFCDKTKILSMCVPYSKHLTLAPFTSSPSHLHIRQTTLAPPLNQPIYRFPLCASSSLPPCSCLRLDGLELMEERRNRLKTRINEFKDKYSTEWCWPMWCSFLCNVVF
jgi:hypothetical protein